MATNFDVSRSSTTADGTASVGFWGHVFVDVEKTIKVPLEFVRRDVERKELSSEDADRLHLEQM